MMYYNRSSLKPAIWLRVARPMCDGRPFASSPFSRVAGRGPSFCGFPLWWTTQIATSVVRCLTLKDSAPRYRKDPLYECGRPHDTLSYLFFTALWLRQSQSILTQAQQTNDTDTTCYKTLLTNSVTCLQVVPMSLVWRVAQPAGFGQSSLSPSHEDPNGKYRVTLFQPLRIYAGGATHFNHLKYNEVVWIGTRVSIFLMAVFCVLPGILDVLLDLRLLHKFPENRSIFFQTIYRKQQHHLPSRSAWEG